MWAAGNEGPHTVAGQAGPLHVVLVNNSDEQAGTQGVHLFNSGFTQHWHHVERDSACQTSCMHFILDVCILDRASSACM